jgi:sugar-specific transcriptional regulator TrmB
LRETDLIEKLKKYGLTLNEAKIYVFLSKKEIAPAREITKKTKVARTETYFVLRNLDKKQLVTRNLKEKPTLYSALSIKKALQKLIDCELMRIKKLNKEKNDVIRLWDSCSF